jgi:hypothetical protein
LEDLAPLRVIFNDIARQQKEEGGDVCQDMAFDKALEQEEHEIEAIAHDE